MKLYRDYLTMTFEAKSPHIVRLNVDGTRTGVVFRRCAAVYLTDEEVKASFHNIGTMLNARFFWSNTKNRPKL